MRILGLFVLKLKNTLASRHNLILLLAMPALAAAGVWTLLSFYLEGGAGIPVGVLDFDGTEFSETVIERFSQNSSVGLRELDFTAWDTGNAADREAGIQEAAVARAVRLVQKRSLEAVVVVHAGFSEKMKAGEPESCYDVICQPTGAARGLVAELFAAEVSRIYFNCDAANRVLRDRVSAARAARLTAPTADERAAIWDEAFRTCDAYWEPEPLMTVDYRPWLPDAGIPDGAAAAAAAANRAPNWNNVREMLNELLSRGVYALFFAYAAFCVLNAAGSAVAERAGGVLTRLAACGLRPGVWTAVSAAAPFLLYGVPAAALLFAITRDAGRTLAALAGLLCLSVLGAFAAGMLKRHGVYRGFTLLLVLLLAVAAY